MFCGYCGDSIADASRFCGNCGSSVSNTHSKVTPSKAGFIGRLHSYGCSRMFFIGSILYSAGVLSLLLNFSLFAIVQLITAVLSVIGVWMVYSASKSPKTPESSLVGLTLFKVAAIIGLVIFCISLVPVIFSGWEMLISDDWGGALIALSFIAFAIIIALFVFYYVALFNVLKSIREGVNNNNVREIKSCGSFVILSFISIGLRIIQDLIFLSMRAAMDAMMFELLREIPSEYRGLVSSLLPNFDTLPILLSLASSVGLIILVVTLKQFADSIKHNPIS